MAKKKTQQEINQMQVESAPGNSSVETRKGGVDNQQTPVISSPNEEPKIVAPVQQINTQAPTQPVQELQTRAQIDNNRKIYNDIANIQDEMIKKDMALETARMNEQAKEDAERAKYTKVTHEQHITPGYDIEQHKSGKWNKEDAEKRMNESDWLKDLNDKVDAKNKEFEDKAKKSSRYAKIAAWGNLFTNLAKLAGGGKQTYVKHDAKYLSDALSKSDKAREIYTAMRESNDKLVRDAKAKWLSEDEKGFYKEMETYNKGVDARNKAKAEQAKGNKQVVRTEYNPSKKEELDLKERGVKATEKRANAYANNSGKNGKDKDLEGAKEDAKAFLNVKDYDSGISYNLNESEFEKVEALIPKSKDGEDYTGMSAAQILSARRKAVLAYIEANKGNEAVKAILDNARQRQYKNVEKSTIRGGNDYTGVSL